MANFNANNRCGASVEGRWTLLKDQHFMWCLPRIGTNDGKAMIELETKIRETGAQACKAGGELKPNGDVLWKGRPIRTLGKNKPQNPALNPDQIDAKPDERKKLGNRDPDRAVKKNPRIRPSLDIVVQRCDGSPRSRMRQCSKPRPGAKGRRQWRLVPLVGRKQTGRGRHDYRRRLPPRVPPLRSSLLGKSGPDNNIDLRRQTSAIDRNENPLNAACDARSPA